MLVTHAPRTGADDDLPPLGSEALLGSDMPPGDRRPPDDPALDDPPPF